LKKKNNIYNIFTSINIKGNKFIKFHTYDPTLFFKVINDKNIDLYLETVQHYSVRLLSFYYNVSLTINLLNISSLTYDKIIVTRADFLHNIKNININNKLQLDNIIYLLRTQPYRVTSNDLHGEERIFVGSYYYISKLKDIYNFVINNWNIIDSKDNYPEKIIYLFFHSLKIY